MTNQALRTNRISAITLYNTGLGLLALSAILYNAALWPGVLIVGIGLVFESAIFGVRALD